MASGCIALATSAVPRTKAFYFIVFTGMLSVVSDFVTAEK